MSTKLDLKAFHPNSQMGLVFSVFDSLKDGEELTVICESNPDSLQKQFQDAKIEKLNWDASRLVDGRWEVTIKKAEVEDLDNGGCCGVCGGHRKHL